MDPGITAVIGLAAGFLAGGWSAHIMRGKRDDRIAAHRATACLQHLAEKGFVHFHPSVAAVKFVPAKGGMGVRVKGRE